MPKPRIGIVMGGSVRRGRVEWMVSGDEEDGLDMMIWIARIWG